MSEEKSYLPCFAEELFIVNLYGSDKEIDRFDQLIENLDVKENLIEIVTLMEELKHRAGNKMGWHCCVECKRGPRCEINALRTFQGLERRCCPNCLKFEECSLMWKRNVPYPKVVLPPKNSVTWPLEKREKSEKK